MSLHKVVKVYWYCAHCNYSTNREPYRFSTRCPACGHDDAIVSNRDKYDWTKMLKQAEDEYLAST